jgi:hypothetical protein
MPSKHKLKLKRAKRRERGRLKTQQAAAAILRQIDNTIDRLVLMLTTLEKARTAAIIRTLNSIE